MSGLENWASDADNARRQELERQHRCGRNEPDELTRLRAIEAAAREVIDEFTMTSELDGQEQKALEALRAALVSPPADREGNVKASAFSASQSPATPSIVPR